MKGAIRDIYGFTCEWCGERLKERAEKPKWPALHEPFTCITNLRERIERLESKHDRSESDE